MTDTRRMMLWRVCCWIMICLSALTFTPLVIPFQQHKPELFGLPYTLWTGFMVALGILVLAALAAWLHPNAEKYKGNE